jgi:hypothetical protein
MLENRTRNGWQKADIGWRREKDKKTIDLNDVWLYSTSVEHGVDENNYEELFKNVGYERS